MCDDENYVIDLCDEVLGIKANRQHRFGFFCPNGDQLTPLVTAYYEVLNLVVEYRDSAAPYNEPAPPRTVTPHWHDQLRRDVLRQHGFRLLEIDYHELAYDGSKYLLRDAVHDKPIIAKKLTKPPGSKLEAEFEDIYRRALNAGQEALAPMLNDHRYGCGFFRIHVNANSKFGRWVIREKGWGKPGACLDITHMVPPQFYQSLNHKSAFGRAFDKVLNDAGIKTHVWDRSD